MLISNQRCLYYLPIHNTILYKYAHIHAVSSIRRLTLPTKFLAWFHKNKKKLV